MKILYPIIDGEITGGNIICFKIIGEALKRGYQTIVNSPAEGKFTRLLKERGIKVYNIDTRRTFRLDSAIKLAQLIKTESIDLIHSHTPLGGTVLSRLAGCLTGVPVITHSHLPDNMRKNSLIRRYQFLLNWFTSRLLSCVKIIAVSGWVKDEIIKQGVIAEKISVIYNGIDLNNNGVRKNPLEIRKEFGLKESQQIVGQVSRLCESKGQHILIEAARKVIKEKPGTVFMLIGEDLEQGGEYKNKLKALAENLGLSGKIIFTDYRPDIRDLMHALDLFVLPSLIEGLPVVILEAMAEKKPVISTSAAGNPEVVIDGETGTLISPEDPDKLADAILYHLNNPEMSEKMGEKGYDRARQFFSLPQMLNKVMDAYKEVFAHRRWLL